ncbi:hypothetical protein BDE02_01G354200 [Populus trichocarpa]|nr:hypothetical protein BDE02_01G354200 [Populus trichocarpa]
MQKSRLRISGTYHSSSVSAWISSAVRARVGEMLMLAEDTKHSLFSCETLVLLNVSCYRIAFHVYPSTVCFPRLKVLHLDCLSPMHGNACIEIVLSLKRLMMQLLRAYDYLEDDDLRAYRILTLDTPNLELLKLTDSASEELNILHKTLSLAEATVSHGHPPFLTKYFDDYAETVVGFFIMIDL